MLLCLQSPISFSFRCIIHSAMQLYSLLRFCQEYDLSLTFYQQYRLFCLLTSEITRGLMKGLLSQTPCGDKANANYRLLMTFPRISERYNFK